MKAPAYQSPRLLAKVSSCGSSRLSLWKTRIENADNNALWRALNRLVSVHPLVRSAINSRQSATNPTNLFSLHDLTQDLYLLLLQKGRFNYYLATQMSDAEIEREIFQIELTNLLIGNLRRRRPENYRIVRRVSGVLENGEHFRRFGKRDKQMARYRQAAEAVFGLRDWGNDKAIKDSGTFADLITCIPMRMRNRRRSGCTGDAQIIVSNQELIELMIEIFETIDSPAPLRVLRQLALSKLPVYDPVMTTIEEDANEEHQGRSYYDSIPSPDASPEEIVLQDEEEEEVRRIANNFLNHLSLLMRSNPRRTDRLWRVLWHCYFNPEEPSQLEIAEMVGISDSSVSDYRRKLENEMRKLDFEPERLHCFAEELDEQLRWRLSISEKQQCKLELDSKMPWLRYDYNTAEAVQALQVV